MVVVGWRCGQTGGQTSARKMRAEVKPEGNLQLLN